jgi:hypothetical protein
MPASPAVIDVPPDADDFGTVVRPIGPVALVWPLGALLNGTETPVGAVAVLVLVGNALRTGAIVQNTGAANIRVGVAGVTATTGIRLTPNDSLLLNMPFCPPDALWAIREGAIDSVAFAAEET